MIIASTKHQWIIIQFLDGKWTDYKVFPDTIEGYDEAFDGLNDLRFNDNNNQHHYHVIHRKTEDSVSYSPLEFPSFD
jgi:hypothetical protein